MRCLLLFLLAGAAAAQTAAAPQLPIKPGEWKMVAMIHGTDGDTAQSFFSCNTEKDLAHLVPQPAHLPAGLACAQDSQTLTADGEVLVISCKSPSALVKITYILTRNSETLVTGTMKKVEDAGSQHEESTTQIAYQWQQDVCVDQPTSGGLAPAAK
jgi:hypothetical protein